MDLLFCTFSFNRIFYRPQEKSDKKGNKNANASVWEITKPDGEIIIVCGLTTWCRENNIPRDRIRFSQCGWQGKNLGKKNKLKGEV